MADKPENTPVPPGGVSTSGYGSPGRPPGGKPPGGQPPGGKPPGGTPPGAPPDPPGDLEAACRRHLEFVRKNCPDLLPRDPVPPGTPVEPVPVPPDRATDLVRTAVRATAATTLGQRPDRPPPSAVTWTDGGDSLLVLLDTVRVSTTEGVVSVGVDVACDQLWAATGEPRGHVDVDLVVGTGDRPTGLLAAATRPRGPAVVVDRWHDALVALAWQALLDTAAGLSAATGSDPDGTPLVPTRWVASRSGIDVGPQARHPFDRRPVDSRRPDSSPFRSGTP